MVTSSEILMPHVKIVIHRRVENVRRMDCGQLLRVATSLSVPCHAKELTRDIATRRLVEISYRCLATYKSLSVTVLYRTGIALRTMRTDIQAGLFLPIPTVYTRAS